MISITKNPCGGAWFGHACALNGRHEIGTSATGKLKAFVSVPRGGMSLASVESPWLLTRINADGLYRSAKPSRVWWFASNE